MLPDGSGLDLLERLKALHKRENVIIISAKDSLEDKVLGLELGADDYLPKPFHLAELNARIKSVIRRNQHDGEIYIRQGNVRIEPDKYRVFVNEQELELNRKEYDILLYFINRPGRLVNKTHWQNRYGETTSIKWITLTSFMHKSKIFAKIEGCRSKY